MSFTPRSLTPALAATVLALALTGCNSGGDDNDSDKDVISGSDVAAKAETALESEVDQLAEGSFECPDADREVGVTVTCARSSADDQLYAVYEGEVEITELDEGGDDFGLHVEMAGEPKEFGAKGDYVAQTLKDQYAQGTDETPSEVDCPDLLGETGAKVTCSVTVSGDELQVEATASEVETTPPSLRFTFAEV